MSKKRTSPAGTRIDVSNEELEALLEGVRVPLGEAGYQKLQAAIRTLGYDTELLETHQATLEKLRRLLVPLEHGENRKGAEAGGHRGWRPEAQAARGHPKE